MFLSHPFKLFSISLLQILKLGTDDLRIKDSLNDVIGRYTFYQRCLYDGLQRNTFF